jgi:hypothetical protein
MFVAYGRGDGRSEVHRARAKHYTIGLCPEAGKTYCSV